MEEENSKKCLVKHKFYDFYYKNENYFPSPHDAVSSYHQIPEHIKQNIKLEIIFLDSKEGLELLTNG